MRSVEQIPPGSPDVVARRLQTDLPFNLLFRRALAAFMDDVDPEASGAAWLQKLNYDASPSSVREALARRRASMGFWSGPYTLFVGGKAGPTLTIDETTATLNGRVVHGFKLSGDTLRWSASDGNPSSAELTFVVTPTIGADGAFRPWPANAYLGMQCHGQYWAAGETQPPADNTRGKMRMFSAESAESPESTDSLASWHGTYALSVDKAQSTLEIDATTLEVSVDGHPVQPYTFNQSILEWKADPQGNQTFGRLVFSSTNTALRVIGSIWAADAERPRVANVVGASARTINGLPAWAGRYTISALKGQSWEALDDALLISDPPTIVTFGAQNLTGYAFHAESAVLDWKSPTGMWQNGSLAFSATGNDKVPRRYDGVVWNDDEARPAQPNLHGTIVLAEPPVGLADSNVAIILSIAAAASTSLLTLLEAYRDIRDWRQRANDAAARGNQAEVDAAQGEGQAAEARVEAVVAAPAVADAVGLADPGLVRDGGDGVVRIVSEIELEGRFGGEFQAARDAAIEATDAAEAAQQAADAVDRKVRMLREELEEHQESLEQAKEQAEIDEIKDWIEKTTHDLERETERSAHAAQEAIDRAADQERAEERRDEAARAVEAAQIVRDHA